MDKKYVVLIILVVAAIAVIGGYLLFNNQSNLATEHTILVLSKSAYMEVPNTSNKTDKADKNGIYYYNDENSDINITSCSNLSASSSAQEMEKLKNNITVGSKKLKLGDAIVFEKDGIYSVFLRNVLYNDTLLIQSSNKDLLLLCWESVKYHDPTKPINFDNDTGPSSGSSVVDAVEKTQSAVQSSSSSSDTSTIDSGSSSSWDAYNWQSSTGKYDSGYKTPRTSADDYGDVDGL